MTFLVDECLHTSLVQVEGFVAFHVNYLGLAGTQDWQLMKEITAAEYTFVTKGSPFHRITET